MKNYCALLLSIIISSLSLTNSIAEPTVKSTRVSHPPDIDGYVNETVWQTGGRITEFLQREPDVGAPATEKTEIYLCYDDDYLYIGCICYDDPTKVTGNQVARDANLRNDDAIKIVIDTFFDRRNAFWFQINPRGCKGDALVTQNGAVFNKSWDGLWIGKSKIVEDGWHTELAIPFKTLSFKKGQTTWGFKVNRNIARKLENVFWPVANPNSYKWQVSDAGLLTSLEGMSQGIGLDVTPYALAGLDDRPPADPEFTGDAGIDFFYQITPEVKGALTINTDFAQTEVDNRLINLTRFALHFPEKRDFFLDGAGYFNFGLELDGRYNPYSKRIIPFFSRQLGLDSGGNPVPILYGGKITGQVGRWNIGLLSIADDRELGTKNFGVARVARNISNQLSIGVIGTVGNALSDVDNYVTGMDFKLATSTFRGNKNLGLILFGLKSNTESLTSKDASWGAEVMYPNDFIYFRSGFHEIGDNFVSGIGFVPRTGIRETYADISIGPRPNRWGIMQYHFTAGIDYITNMENKLETRRVNILPMSIRFTSGEEISFGITPLYEQLRSDFQIHPTDTVFTIRTEKYEFNRYLFTVNSAMHRKFWASMIYEWGDFYTGTRNETILELGYKFGVLLFVGLAYEHNDISLATGTFDTDVFRTNINFLFSPSVTLYNFVQYDNLSKHMGWQSRFVWIMKPGNEILLVYRSVAQDPFEHFQMEETNVRLKLRYNYRF